MSVSLSVRRSSFRRRRGRHSVSELQPSAMGSISAAVSNAVVRLISEYTGRGPTKARTAINRDVVTVVLADTMTKAERTLAANGKAELVLRLRQEFQRTMRDDLIAAVEMLM